MIFDDVSSVPDRQTADLDETTKKLIADEYRRSQEDPSIAQGKINTDMKTGQDTFDSGFAGAGLNDAIKQKYSGLLGNKLQSSGADLKLSGRFKQADQMKRAQSALLAQTQVQNDIFAKNLEANQMKEAARADAINSILGFGGSVAGAYLGARKPKEEKKQLKGKRKTSGGDDNGGAYGNVAVNYGSPGMNRSMNYLQDIEDEYA